MIIDEVQKIPSLLDEIHWLIENATINLLYVAPAPENDTQQVNLLGGRALSKKCFPLVYKEFQQNNETFELQKVLQRRLIPLHYFSDNDELQLESYVNNYLTQEIKNEAWVKNWPAFYRL